MNSAALKANTTSIVLSRKSDYIASLFDPSNYLASIPDDILVKHYLKNEPVTQTVDVRPLTDSSSTGSGLFIFVMNTPLNIVGAHYYYDQIKGRYIFDTYIRTAQDIRESYDQSRHCAFTIDIVQNTISTTNFTLSGTFNAINYQGTITELGIENQQNHSEFYNKLLSNTANQLDLIGNVRMSDGVSLIALPCSFDIPYTRLSDQSPSSSNVGDPFTADIVDNSQELIYNFAQEFTTPGSLLTYKMAMNVDQFTGPVSASIAGLSSGATDDETTYAVQFELISPFGEFVDSSTIVTTSSFGSDLQASTLLNIKEPIGSVRVTILLGGSKQGDVRYTRVNMQFRCANANRFGLNTPLSIVAYNGCNKDAQISMSGSKNFELIPNPITRKNIRTDYTRHDGHEMQYVKTLLSSRDALGVRSVMSIPMRQKFLNYYKELGSIDNFEHADAMGWGDILRAIKKIAVPALSTLMPELKPIFGAGNALADRLLDRYSPKAHAASGLPPHLANAMNKPLPIGVVLGRDLDWEAIEEEVRESSEDCCVTTYFTEMYKTMDKKNKQNQEQNLTSFMVNTTVSPNQKLWTAAPTVIDITEAMREFWTEKTQESNTQINPAFKEVANAMNSTLENRGIEPFDNGSMSDYSMVAEPDVQEPDKRGIMPLGHITPTHLVKISDLEDGTVMLFPTLIGSIMSPFKAAMYALVKGDRRDLLCDKAKNESFYDPRTKNSIYGYTADSLPFKLSETFTALPVSDFCSTCLSVPLQAPYVAGESIHGAIYALTQFTGKQANKKDHEQGVYGPVTGAVSKNKHGEWVLESCPVYAQKKAYSASRGLNLVGSGSTDTPTTVMISKLINNKKALDCTIKVGLPVVELLYPSNRHEVAYASNEEMTMAQLGQMMSQMMVQNQRVNERLDAIETTKGPILKGRTRDKSVTYRDPIVQSDSDYEEEPEVLPEPVSRSRPTRRKYETDEDDRGTSEVTYAVNQALSRGVTSEQIINAIEALNVRTRMRGPSQDQARDMKIQRILDVMPPIMHKVGVDENWVIANKVRGASAAQLSYAMRTKKLPPPNMMEAEVSSQSAGIYLPPEFPDDTPIVEGNDTKTNKLNAKWINWLKSSTGQLNRYGRTYVDIAYEYLIDNGFLPDATGVRDITEEASTMLRSGVTFTPFLSSTTYATRANPASRTKTLVADIRSRPKASKPLPRATSSGRRMKLTLPDDGDTY
jgi:hypothetical protein